MKTFDFCFPINKVSEFCDGMHKVGGAHHANNGNGSCG